MELLSPANESKELEEAAEEGYKMTEALALFWNDAAGVRNWNIGFYAGKNSDGTLWVDNLVRTNRSYKIWRREDVDDM